VAAAGREDRVGLIRCIPQELPVSRAFLPVNEFAGLCFAALEVREFPAPRGDWDPVTRVGARHDETVMIG